MGGTAPVLSCSVLVMETTASASSDHSPETAGAILSRPAAERGNFGHRFKEALLVDGVSVIAEVKRRSPSRGDLRADADAGELARQYLAGGASCLSVLTDRQRFGGSPDDLRQARAAVGVPVLRKDFLTSLEDVRETHAMGADALLLIVADLDASSLQPMQELALSKGMDVLTEVRTEQELEIALDHGAYMIAVNQRNDPKDSGFTVDYGKAVAMSRLFSGMDDAIVKVAASGIGVEGGTGMDELLDAGYDAALIGEALVTAADPAAKLRSLLASVLPANSMV